MGRRRMGFRLAGLLQKKRRRGSAGLREVGKVRGPAFLKSRIEHAKLLGTNPEALENVIREVADVLSADSTRKNAPGVENRKAFCFRDSADRFINPVAVECFEILALGHAGARVRDPKERHAVAHEVAVDDCKSGSRENGGNELRDDRRAN